MSRYTFKRAFRVEPYGCHVYFFTDPKKWARFVARRTPGKYRDRLAEATGAGICLTNNEQFECYVGVFSHGVGALAHEMTHAAMRILGWTGVRVTRENHEALAYLVGYMVGKCAEFV